MTTFHSHEFCVGLNGQCVEIVKSLQSSGRVDEGMVLGLDGPELLVGCDAFPQIGIIQLSKKLFV